MTRLRDVMIHIYRCARAIAVARQEGYNTWMLPGISAEDYMFADLEFDPSLHGCKTCEATEILLRDKPLDPSIQNIIWQVRSVMSSIWNSHRRPARRTDLLEQDFLGLSLHYLQLQDLSNERESGDNFAVSIEHLRRRLQQCASGDAVADAVGNDSRILESQSLPHPSSDRFMYYHLFGRSQRSRSNLLSLSAIISGDLTFGETVGRYDGQTPWNAIQPIVIDTAVAGDIGTRRQAPLGACEECSCYRLSERGGREGPPRVHESCPYAPSATQLCADAPKLYRQLL
ncbi:hypothetical protein K503DRAFT_780202 [Rhizopogon vinicolor AM-OR11-026]|uniref:Uncharacterized protein n=1 Tax=Rhizopogon vinicolor AM-OR11-026 TaxID=1314800 RepID=A0A1B7NAX3_9AGAM|nr:hypothetical protein K503DRAFT_780202 [Rhizopogon vinicolor AM-OR11-026]